MVETDVIVIGAGAVGASTALHLARAGRRVLVLEKETGPALHQSGRNSGVIHAGYNLKPGSNKARFCIEGSRRLRAYCEQKGIPVQVGGILVVARTEGEREVLAELYRRAQANGTAARMLDERGLREVEPHAAGIEALQAQEGASFDARAYVHALAADAVRAGAEFLYDTRVLAIEDPGLGPSLTPEVDPDPPARPRGEGDLVVVRTSKGPLAARALVNAAGLHADRLAALLAKDIRVIPFRGYYAELRPDRRDLVRSHIYAAPDLQFPFLGVHLSRRVDGRVIVGPGAMLAFGREAYRFHQVQPGDLGSVLSWPGFYRMLVRPEFRRLIVSEVAKSLRLESIREEASLLVPALKPGDLVQSYAGNRAQLVSRDGRLVDDLVVRETPRAVHVLNAVSPGLTCSLPFGEHLAELCASRC
jgi:(S)-2-hydroxyglutarate dehydrogenase